LVKSASTFGQDTKTGTYSSTLFQILDANSVFNSEFRHFKTKTNVLKSSIFPGDTANTLCQLF
jgi:hypothetical protein